MTFAAPSSRVETLLSMLAYRRPGGSKTERRFIREFIDPLGVEVDAVGNRIKRVGDAPILWSSHTDTVHRHGGTQEVVVVDNMAAVGPGSNCLGADCTTGVWLMTEMIKAGVPGLYIFHREEEWGGIGSSHVADNTPGLLAGISCAIAFDRKGTGSIVTHQAGGRCCSDAFAGSLGAALKMPALVPDTGGTFTDTANYTHLIPECTNISVGYYGQHTAGEMQDLEFAERLLDALLAADFSELVVQRDPTVVETRYGGLRAGSVTWKDDAWWDQAAEPWLSPAEAFGRRHTHDIRSLLRDHADELAEWLEDNGISAADLVAEIEGRGGVVD